MLVGALLAVALRHWVRLLPRAPESAVLTAGARATRAAVIWGAVTERIDEQLRQWPVAGVFFLALTVILAAALLAGRLNCANAGDQSAQYTRAQSDPSLGVLPVDLDGFSWMAPEQLRALA